MFTLRQPSIDLNGTWGFVPDPMQRCRRQQWWRNSAKPNSVMPCWDPEGMWEVTVPGTWKTQFRQLEWYDGHAVYFKEFAAPEIAPDQEAFLVFDGIVYASEIVINGHRVARHDWGYSCFQVRVTELLRSENQLFVLVDNTLSANRVPGEIFDWCNDGGIINSVKLIFVPATHIHNFRASTCIGGNMVRLEYEVSLGSRDAKALERVELSIPELGLNTAVDVAVGQPAKVSFKIGRNEIRLWSPEDPKLYRTELRTRFETITDEIGYREIRTEGQQIILNGQPIRLYGVSVHADFPGTGRTATEAGIETMVQTVKKLGLNFVRCAHYPYAEIFGRAMDKAGILWWEEVPAYWLFAMREEKMSELACGMLEETVRRDWNRAGLIVWSVSNECCWRDPEDPRTHNYAYWFKAVELVRRLDPNRLVSCAEAQNLVSQAIPWSPGNNDTFLGSSAVDGTHRPMHSDEFYQLFDILAANLYVSTPGEERTLYPRFVELFKRYNKPLMLSEFGSLSLRGSDAPSDHLGSESRHALMIKSAYEVLATMPEVVGYSPWVLADMRSPIHWRWYNLGSGIYRYGFVDDDWQPKQAFFALKESVARLKELWAEPDSLTDELRTEIDYELQPTGAPLSTVGNAIA